MRCLPTATASATLILVASGCASAGGGSDVIRQPDEVVSASELSSFVNLRAALREQRPGWLRNAREVFVDGVYRGMLSSLNSVPIEDVARVELISPGEAARRFKPCQAPPGTGANLERRGDPDCGTRPVIHIVVFRTGAQAEP